MLGTKHSTQNKLCWILLLELSDSQNSAVFLLLLVWLSIRRFFLRYCSSFSEKPQILLFYWYILVFLSALSPKSDFRMLMLLRPFPALGNLFKSLLLFMDIKYCQKKSELYSLWWEERSLIWEIRRACWDGCKVTLKWLFENVWYPYMDTLFVHVQQCFLCAGSY